MIRFSPNPNRANLINWFEWGDEAFRAAQEQNKPIMLFLSAFWCRYCQRMDEEALSETENIAVLRAYFIPIRAEDAQRPDIDVRYNQNGWPTIVFMTPRGEPIVAANYLPADQFQDLMLSVYMGQQKDRGASQDNKAGNPDETVVAPVPGVQLDASSVTEIAGVIMSMADLDHGGYGNGQKFIQSAPNDFLISLYEAAKNPEYLNHVCSTLDRMRNSAIHDHAAGGYFRTSTGPDWDQPHREKLLAEQAGLVLNCLGAYSVTQLPEYARMAEETINYLNSKLFDHATGAFYGCEDFLRVEGAEQASRDEFFTILDKCYYTDANALAISAYLKAAASLRKEELKHRALVALEFIWSHCRQPAGGMFHYFDGAPHLSGWLGDQVLTGMALLDAHEYTGKSEYLDRAKELAKFIISRFKNPVGGYFDIAARGPAYLNVRLTLVEHNGSAASFFLALAAATGNSGWRDDAFWALSAFREDFQSHGTRAAALGRALIAYFER